MFSKTTAYRIKVPKRKPDQQRLQQQTIMNISTNDMIPLMKCHSFFLDISNYYRTQKSSIRSNSIEFFTQYVPSSQKDYKQISFTNRTSIITSHLEEKLKCSHWKWEGSTLNFVVESTDSERWTNRTPTFIFSFTFHGPLSHLKL